MGPVASLPFVGRGPWKKGEEGGRLSQGPGIQHILYWSLCRRGENQRHHPHEALCRTEEPPLFGLVSAPIAVGWKV